MAGMTGTTYSISVVVPLFNEEATLEELHRRLRATLATLGHPFEMVLVNDGSRDRTGAILDALARADASVRVVTLAGNSGQTAALAAGFAHAHGDVIIPMDGDLQHLPEEIPLFLEKIDEGYDIVSGWRRKRQESMLLRRIPSLIANRLIAWASGVQVHDFGTTFKAYRREVLARITLYGDFHRFIPALAKPLRARITEIPIAAPARLTGQSKYGIGRTITVFFDILRIRFLLSFLSRPLQFFGAGGFLLIAGGGVMGLMLLYEKFGMDVAIMSERGPFFIATVFLLLAGLQLLSIGFLGELITRLYHEVRPRGPGIRSVTGGGLPPPMPTASQPT